MADALMIGEQTLTAFMKDAGYALTKIGEATWRSRIPTPEGNVPLLVHVGDGFLTLAIIPLVSTPEEREPAVQLYDRLLHLNHELFMAKLSIDDDLDVVLSVEYPLGDLDPSEVTDSLAALSHYVAQHRGPLRALVGAKQ